MSASGNEDTMADQAKEPKAKIGDQEFTKEEFLDTFAGVEQWEEPESEQDDIILWATVTYEEGTSGPILKAEGVLVDDEYGVSILDPESNEVTSVGDRFVISVVVRQVLIEDDDDDDDEDEDQDQVDTSADRFRA